MTEGGGWPCVRRRERRWCRLMIIMWECSTSTCWEDEKLEGMICDQVLNMPVTELGWCHRDVLGNWWHKQGYGRKTERVSGGGIRASIFFFFSSFLRDILLPLCLLLASFVMYYFLLFLSLLPNCIVWLTEWHLRSRWKSESESEQSYLHTHPTGMEHITLTHVVHMYCNEFGAAGSKDPIAKKELK